MREDFDLLTNIRIKLPSMSKSKKRVAAFLLENYDKAVYLTAARLGSVTGVSESTVVRFAIDLGFDGYPQLQQELEALVKIKMTATQRLATSSGINAKGDKSILRIVLESDADRIRTTLDELDENAFNDAVDEILKAGKVYITGGRSSSYIAGFLSYYLNLIIENVINMNPASSSEVFEQIFRIKEGDVCIGISYPRYSQRTIKAMEYAKERKATTIAITDSLYSPIAIYSNICLITKSNMLSFVDSLVTPMSLINALIVAISERRKTELVNTFDLLEKLWDEYQVYSVEWRGRRSTEAQEIKKQ